MIKGRSFFRLFFFFYFANLNLLKIKLYIRHKLERHFFKKNNMQETYRDNGRIGLTFHSIYNDREKESE